MLDILVAESFLRHSFRDLQNLGRCLYWPILESAPYTKGLLMLRKEGHKQSSTKKVKKAIPDERREIEREIEEEKIS